VELVDKKKVQLNAAGPRSGAESQNTIEIVSTERLKKDKSMKNLNSDLKESEELKEELKSSLNSAR
jgi:hypothetical protein